MKEKVEQLKAEIDAFAIDSAEALEKFRIAFLGSKGAVKGLFAELKEVPNEAKREAGQLVNGLRQFAQDKMDAQKEALSGAQESGGSIDVTRPGDAIAIGSRHSVPK